MIHTTPDGQTLNFRIQDWKRSPGHDRKETYWIDLNPAWPGIFELSRIIGVDGQMIDGWGWCLSMDSDREVFSVQSFDTPDKAVANLLSVVARAAEALTHHIKGGTIK